MIVGVAITNRVTSAVSGIDRDYAPVCADLAEGWTLVARDDLADRPERLQLIGRRYTYIALLEEDQLLLIGARERRAWDGSDEDVLKSPRYYEQFTQTHASLDSGALAILTERWDRAHAQRAAMQSERIGHWKELNRIRAFVAHEHGAVVPLAEQPWDQERLAEGQLVLHTLDPTTTAAAVRDFTYRLPNLDVPLRVEDTGEGELLIDCGEEDLIRVERYLKGQDGKPLRLTIDSDETDKQIEREKRTLREAEKDERLRTLIADPTLARRTPARRPDGFSNLNLDDGQQQVVTAASVADDVLVVQGPPGTGKTTAICEIVSQALIRDPHAQILVAAQTHQAVDNVLLRLTATDPDLPIARVASVHTIDRVNETIRERYWTHSDEPWHPPIVRRAFAYRALIDAQTRAGDRTEDETMRQVLKVQEDYLASVGPQRTPQERLAQARVIAGTCAAVQGNQEVRTITFALAILEEAGKATPPEALMILLRSKKGILVGDSRQLPPHIWDPMRTVLRQPDQLQTTNKDRSKEAGELRAAIGTLGSTPQQREQADQKTLFDHFTEHLKGTPNEATLSTQYRMLPEIGELIGHVFYNDIGGLRHGRERPVDPRVQAFAGRTRVRLIDIPGQEEYDGKSKHRGAEVKHVSRELKALQDHAATTGPPPNGPDRLGVAVITPYAAQARRLRAALDLSTYPALNVRIGIVDRFQGDEDQVVILTIAATRVAGFLKLPNRINVALSRAQDLLILTTSLEPALRGRIGGPLQSVARFITQQVESGHPGYEITRPPKPRRRGGRQTRQAQSERAT
jgi:ATP-dependent RNA/DNA helicase IGHMBP2